MKLTEMRLDLFLDELASNSPAPGGGSTAALAGALSCALIAMVAGLTIGKNKYKTHWVEMENVQKQANTLRKELSDLFEQDTEAYNQVSTAFRLPKTDKADVEIRAAAIQEATKNAAIVPLNTLKTVANLSGLVAAVIERGNTNCLTDAAVAAQLMRSAALGAGYNVRINLATLNDREFVKSLSAEVSTILSKLLAETTRIEGQVELILNSAIPK